MKIGAALLSNPYWVKMQIIFSLVRTLERFLFVQRLPKNQHEWGVFSEFCVLCSV